MAKGYAVLPINYEYNDEVYERKGYGKVQKIYKSRAKAIQACNEANLKFLASLNSYDYSYSPGFKGLLDETLPYGEGIAKQELMEMFAPVLAELNDDEINHGQVIIKHLKTLDTNQQERFYEFFPVLQYNVVEVEIT